ncbi:MAG: hypothetical protein N2Z80_02135 [Hydrogenothermaceae bacterium]|nr:hypothetical protein [Hydrogenothermaceae bacterium]
MKILRLKGKVLNVCIESSGGLLCFSFRRVNRRFQLADKSVHNKGEFNLSKDFLFSKFMDTLEIRKVEIPKGLSKKFTEGIISQELGEDISKNSVFKYDTCSLNDKSKTLNVIYFHKTDFYDTFSGDIAEKVKFFTYIPLSLTPFLSEYIDKNVLYVHLFENSLFIIFSVNGVIDFYRYSHVYTKEDIYENIVLTYRYVSSSIGKIDLLLLSLKNSVEMLESLNFYEVFGKDVAMLNPLYYLDTEDGDVEGLYDCIIPVGVILLSESNRYNFLPEDILYDRNFIFSVKVLLIVFSIISLGLLFKIFINAADIFDKYLYLKDKELQLNKDVAYIKDRVKIENIQILEERNSIITSRLYQSRVFNRLLKYTDFFTEENLKISIDRADKGYIAELTFSKNFNSIKEVERFYEQNKDKMSLSKDYKSMMVEAKIIYVEPEKGKP